MDTKSTAPFVGLRPFEEESSHLFFGRRNQMNELLDRLESTRLVAIVGSSGCGKSSLVRAGLVPALKAGFLVKSRAAWRVLVIKPGKAPIRHLAAAVLRDGGEGEEEPAEEELATLEQEIRVAGAEAVLERLAGSAEKGDHNVLLVVDQFEEIFRFGLHEKNQELRDEAADFVSVLLALAEESALPVYVVLTMRADFIRDCDDIPDLPDALNRSLFLVPRLTREQFREAIEGPVRWSDGSIANRLLDRLLNDSNREHDELPVLQHALLRTWREWSEDRRGPMDTEHYEHAGTVERALDLDAEAALAGLDEAGLDRVRRLFQALTAVDDANRKIRRPARLGELEHITGLGREEILPLLERFRADGRSLLVWSDADPDPLIDISHESLIRNWRRLAGWADEEAESVALYRRLADAAAEYPDRGGLWSDPRLQIGLDWHSRYAPTRTWAERAVPGTDFERSMRFLDESREAREDARAGREREKEEAHERELAREREKHRLRGTHRLLATAAGSLVLMAGLVVYALAERDKAIEQEQLVQEQLDKAKRVKTYLSLVSQTWSETQAYPPRGLLFASAALSRGLSIEEVPPDDLARGERSFLRALSRSGGRGVASGGGSLAGLAVTPGDRWLVAVDRDGDFTCWSSPAAEAAGGHEEALQDRSTGLDQVNAATMAGDQLVVGAETGEVRALAAARGGCPGRESRTLATLGSPVRDLAASPDGRWLAALGAGGKLELLDLETPAPRGAPLRESGVEAVAIGGEPGSLWLAIGRSDGVVELRPLGADGFAGATVEIEGNGASVETLGASPGTSRLFVAWVDGKTALFDAADLSERPRLVSEAIRLEEEEVVAAELRPDGRRLVAWGDDGAVVLWDLAAETPREVSRLASSGEGGLHWGAFGGAGEWLYTAHLLTDDGERPWEVRRWRLTAFDPALETLEHALPKEAPEKEAPKNEIHRVAFSPDRTRVLVLDKKGGLALWCLCPAGKCPTVAASESVCREGALAPARTWGPDAGHPKVGAAAFAADGSVVVAWQREDGRVDTFPPADGPREPPGAAARWSATQAQAQHGEIEVGRRRVMTADDNGLIAVWDLEGGTEPIFSARLSAPVLAARFFGEERLITASPPEPLTIHDLSSGEPGAVIEDSRGLDLRALDVSPDRSWLAAGDSEGMVRFWRLTAADGAAATAVLDETLPPIKESDPVVAVAFTPDGKDVLVTTEAGTTRRWPLLSADRFRLARDLVGEGELPAEMREALALRTYGDVFTVLLQGAGEVPAEPLSDPVALAAKGDAPAGLPRPERRTW